MPLLKTGPSFGTITLTAAKEGFKIRSTDATKNTKTFIITNLSTTAPIFVASKSDATATTEEYQLAAGASLNLDFTRYGSFDVYVRGTAGEKVTYAVI